MKLEVLNDRVAIELDAPETETPGGIVLPDNAKDRPTRGVVVCAGSGNLNSWGKRIPLLVKEGDRVMIGKYVGDDVEVGERTFRIVREEDILAKVEQLRWAKVPDNEKGVSRMIDGLKTGDGSLEKTPLTDLEFLGVPVSVINLVEVGMNTLWVEGLPHMDELKDRLEDIRMMGPRSVDVFIKGVVKIRKGV